MSKQEWDDEAARLWGIADAMAMQLWRQVVRPMWILILILIVVVAVCNALDIHL